MRVKKYATNELTASAARRFQQFRGRKSNVASTKPKLNYLFLSSINLVFVIAIGIWMTASMAVRPQASQRCDKLSPDFFSCLFCRWLRCAPNAVVRVTSVLNSVLWLLLFFSVVYVFGGEKTGNKRQGGKNYTTESHTQWKPKLTYWRNSYGLGVRRTWNENWEVAPVENTKSNLGMWSR